MADDELKIKVKAELDDSGIKDDVVDVGKNLAKSDDGHVKLVGQLDIDETRKKISAQLKNLKIDGTNVDIGISNKSVTKDIKNISNQISEQLNKTSQKINTVKKSFAEFDIDKTFKRGQGTLAQVARYFNDFGETTTKWTKNAKGKINGFIASVKDANGVVEDFRFHYNMLGKNENGKRTYGFEYTGSSVNDNAAKVAKEAEKALEAQRKETEKLVNAEKKRLQILNETSAKYLRDINSKNSAALDSNGTKGLTSESDTGKVKAKYKKVLELVEAYKASTAETASANKIAVENEIKAYDDLVRQLKNAAFAANELRTKDITTVKEVSGNKFNDFKAKIDGSLVSTKDLEAELRKCDSAFNAITDESSLTEFLNQFDIAKSKFNQLNTEAKNYEETQKRLAATEKEIALAQTKAQKEIDSTQNNRQLQYYSKLRSENQTLFNLQKQRITAGTEEAKEIDKQIAKTNSRISATKNLIDKQDLYNKKIEVAIDAENRLHSEQLSVLNAKTTDKNSQVGLDTSTMITQLNTLEEKWEKEGILVDDFEKKVKKLKKTLNSTTTTTGLTNAQKQMRSVTTEAKSLEDEIKRVQSAVTLNQDKTILSNRVAAYMASNTKAAKVYRQEFEKIQAQLKDKNLDASGLKNVRKEFQNLTTAAKAAGNNVDTLGDRIKKAAFKFSQWMSLTTVISTGVRAIKDMIQNVIDLDTAMVSLKKVTDETEANYNRFLTNSYENAKKLGKSVSDLVEQTAEWSKLGYKLSEATALAQVSSIYANVGEVDNATAVSDLVTVIKAFNIETSDTITIVNALNKLGNEFATDAKSLGAGLSNAASQMALAGDDLASTLAMLTGGSEITQEASEMGNALKVFTMRIQGMKGKLEELGEEYENVESISKIQTHILNLTNGAINIFKDDGSFKSSYEILKSISEIYDKLSDTNAADLRETLFSKQRGNSGAAIIQAFQSGQIQKAYEAVQNSAGSAMAEQEKWLDSIEAKLNQLEATAEQFSATIVDDNSIKNSVDMLSGLLSVLNGIVSTVGTLPTLIGAVTAALSIKNVGKPYGMCHLMYRYIIT